MHKVLGDVPTQFETDRLVLRCYRPDDAAFYYAASQRNRAHLARYESGNSLMHIDSEEQAEFVVRDLQAQWAARTCFLSGVFLKATGEWVAQVYAGPVDPGLPEFEIGYIADVDHEGRGYVTEAVRATLRFVFEHLRARRISLRCDDTNVRSRRVAERCGMRLEGHLRENKRNADGSISGTLCFGLVRGDLPIETGRLVLRRFALEDARNLLALVSHPSFSRAVPEMQPTQAGVRHYIERQLAYQAFEPERVFDLAIERREDRRVIGLLTLVRKGEGGAIGWALGADFRRQGYAAEAAAALLDYAFVSLGLERVEAETATGNEASWRLMERLGMRREACLAGGTAEDGQPADSYLYVVRPEEWRMARLCLGPAAVPKEEEECPSDASMPA